MFVDQCILKEPLTHIELMMSRQFCKGDSCSYLSVHVCVCVCVRVCVCMHA